jgi:hypothetical protein
VGKVGCGRMHLIGHFGTNKAKEKQMNVLIQLPTSISIRTQNRKSKFGGKIGYIKSNNDKSPGINITLRTNHVLNSARLYCQKDSDNGKKDIPHW